MKTILLMLLMMPYGINGFCQSVEPTDDKTEQTNKIIAIAKDVAMTFGPEWFGWEVTASVSDVQKYNTSGTPPRMPENIGREYQTGVFHYDSETTKEIRYTYAAKVRLWTDTLLPLDVSFGNDWWILFDKKPYAQWKREGVDKSNTIPFDPLPKEVIGK